MIRLNFLGVRCWTGSRDFRLLMLAAGYVGLVGRCSETEGEGREKESSG